MIALLVVPITLFSKEDYPNSLDSGIEASSDSGSIKYDNDFSSSLVDSVLENTGFSVKAYAAPNTNPLIMPGEENLIVFDTINDCGSETYWPDENGNTVCASFKPITFVVEGDNIARIQINVSKGELYAQVSESVDKRKNPEKFVGEEGLDPTERGKKKYYEDCDTIETMPYAAPDDPYYAMSCERVYRMKRIGSVVDANKKADERVGTHELQFGLIEYLDNSFFEGPVLSDREIVDGDGRALSKEATGYRSELDGAILTITVTYDDESHETQVISLHQGVIASDDEGNIVEPVRFFDEKKGDTFGELIMYGKVLSVSDDSFPYSDLPANEYAYEVMPALSNDASILKEFTDE